MCCHISASDSAFCLGTYCRYVGAKCRQVSQSCLKLSQSGLQSGRKVCCKVVAKWSHNGRKVVAKRCRNVALSFCKVVTKLFQSCRKVVAELSQSSWQCLSLSCHRICHKVCGEISRKVCRAKLSQVSRKIYTSLCHFVAGTPWGKTPLPFSRDCSSGPCPLYIYVKIAESMAYFIQIDGVCRLFHGIPAAERHLLQKCNIQITSHRCVLIIL